MSHHLDTPLAAQTGQLYIDDLYVFPGEGSTVFIMDVNSNVNGLHSEPGFRPEARYEIKVHFDGADFETLTYRVSFGEPDSDGRQPLRLHALTGDQAQVDQGRYLLPGRPALAPALDHPPQGLAEVRQSVGVDRGRREVLDDVGVDLALHGPQRGIEPWQRGHPSPDRVGPHVYVQREQRGRLRGKPVHQREERLP